MNIELNKKVLDLLYNSVISEGGDGDAIWLTKYTPLNEVIELIEAFNVENKTNWTVTRESEHNYIWGDNQEWVIITDSEESYKASASYIILQINY